MVAEPATSQMVPPVPYAKLRKITNDACEATFESVDGYDHSQTGQWNTNIIQTILQSLISESSSPSSPPSYKYAVNSTIIQHQIPSSSSTPRRPTNDSSTSTMTGPDETSTIDGQGDERSATSTEPTSTGGGARRGMHSATGAYWNTEKDGMWSYKYEAGETKGFDVVICVIWMAV